MSGLRWFESTLLCLDTETSGIDVWNDRIVTACTVEITPGGRPEITTWLINPGIEIPAEATEVHGITTAYATEHGRDPEPALNEITTKVAWAMHTGVPVVAFNAAYDLTILEAENQRHSTPTLRERLPQGLGAVVDVHVIDKALDKYRKGSRKLVDTAAHYGVRLSADGAHDASTDALAAGRMVPRLVAAFPELAGMPLPHLHQMQIRWRREQMDGLRRYFDRKGIEHDGCDPGFPLRTDAPKAAAS